MPVAGEAPCFKNVYAAGTVRLGMIVSGDDFVVAALTLGVYRETSTTF